MSLDQLYEKHLLGLNRWSRGNEGFDLGRYFGTRFTLYRHPHIPYIFWWQRNWQTTENEEIPNMHPLHMMLYRKNTKLILPIAWGRKKPKRVFIKPPTLQQTSWYYQSSWSGTALFRYAIIPVNLQNPWVHNPMPGNNPKYAVSVGFAQDISPAPPFPIRWSYTTLAGFDTEVNYRWWWDNGEDNYIMINARNENPGSNVGEVMPVNMPYYKFFWGSRYPTSTDETHAPGTGNPNFVFGKNPSPYAIFWYKDPVIKFGTESFMDTRYTLPSDLPTKTKVWVILTDKKPNYNSTETLKNGITEAQVTNIIQGILSHGPFVLGRYDIPWSERQMNFFCRYQSFWEWGGVSPQPDLVTDPRWEGSSKPSTVQVRNPATVGDFALHPWDLTNQGLITKRKLQTLLAETLRDPAQLPEFAPRQEAPQRSPETGGSPWHDESDQSSEDVSLASEEGDSEEEAKELDPKQTRQILRHLLRHRRHGDDKLRKLKRIIYNLAT